MFGLIPGLISGLISGLIFGLMAYLIGGLLGSEVDLSEKDSPNQGIRLSLRSGLIFGLIFGLSGGLIGRLIFELHSMPFGGPLGRLMFDLRNWSILMMGTSSRLIYELSAGFVFVLVFGLRFGLRSAIQHGVLRFVLFCWGYAPWNYARFLEQAVRHRFVQRVGGRYRFMHDLLRQHFAEMEAERVKGARRAAASHRVG